MLNVIRGRCIPLVQTGRALISVRLSSSGNNGREEQKNWRNRKTIPVAILGGSLLAAGLYSTYDRWQTNPGHGVAASTYIYTEAEVAKHRSKEDGGIWVTYKGKVYDVTDFVEGHPGGNKILLAAGGALEPFWNLYAVHQNPEVLKILAEMEIGLLDERESKKPKSDISNDPFALEPSRHPALKVVSPKPFNAEANPDLVTDNFYTPNELFFVRNHLPVPTVDPKAFRLEIASKSGKPVQLDLSKLKKLPKKTVTSTIMCAGNRRSDMHAFRPVKGLGWEKSAISNATWSGVLLCDLLKAMGIKDLDCKHVQFVGLDKDVTGATYGASIPAEIALDPKSDILVAYEMNGEELPIDHGYPLRLVAPGIVGARQVKWLSKIILSDVESDSHWQQNDYKTFSPSIDWNTLDYSKSPAIMDPPVNSAICTPSQGVVIEDENSIEVKGYAWSGGGRGIIRVEVSADNGATWHLAELEQIQQPLRQQWAWTLWTIDLPLPTMKRGTHEIQIICKAVDTSQATQPESYLGTWNVRGLIANAWHKVPIKVRKT